MLVLVRGNLPLVEEERVKGRAGRGDPSGCRVWIESSLNGVFGEDKMMKRLNLILF